MTSLLLSFLGRTPKKEGRYRSTQYHFDDGTTDTAAFFGFSLQRRIRPDRVVIFGTSGSMWDHLFEHDIALADVAEAERLALIEAVEHQQVTQAQLDQLAPTLSAALGTAVALRIIPYAQTEAEQLDIVRALIDATQDVDSLHLDITHGFRHLPLLATSAAQYLRALRPQMRLQAVWYGAFDPDTHHAPVHNLAGLLHIGEWANAITRFDKDGDYGTLADLMPDDAAPMLRQAAFLERTHQTGQARGRLKAVRSVLNESEFTGLAGLFQSELKNRFDWIDENRLYQRQRQLAMRSLERGDYLRAALYGFEGLITRVMTEQAISGRNPENFEHRQDAKADHEASLKGSHNKPQQADYRLLRDIRNQLAHGISSPRADVQRAMADSAMLNTTLRQLFERLLPNLD